MQTPEERYRIFKEEKERLKSMSPEQRYEMFKSFQEELKKARYEALPEEIPLFTKQPQQPTQLGASQSLFGLKPSFNLLPEPETVFTDPQQPTRAIFKAKEAGLAEAAPAVPELRAETGKPFFRVTSQFENQLQTAKEARLLREKYDPGDRFAAFVDGILPTPAKFKPAGFDQAFPVHRLAGNLTRILLLGKAAATKGVATETAGAIKQFGPYLTGKAAAGTPIVSQIMNYDIPATLASKILFSEWGPAVIGNAVERGLVWGMDSFIRKLGETLSPKEAVKHGATGFGFGGALGTVQTFPFTGISAPTPAGQIGMSKLFGQAVMEQGTKPIEFGHVLPVVLAGGIGGTRAALLDYWEQGNKFKKSAFKEALLASAWTGLIEGIAHKDLVNEWKRFNLENYLWDKAAAYAAGEILRPDHIMSREALQILYYNNFRLDMSPVAHAKHVYEAVMNETLPNQFNFLQPAQLSQIQTELAHRVTGGENAIEAFGDIISQFAHALSKVNIPVSEVEIPGMVLPSKYRTDFAQLLREQIIESERVPLHPAKEAKAIQDSIVNKLKTKYPEYDMEKAIDEAQAKLPPKYQTAFAEALQRRLKFSEAVPLHPSEIGRDAERVAEEISEIQEGVISKAEAMPWRQFTEGITREEQRGLAKIQKRLEPLTVPAKEKKPLSFIKPEGKSRFQEYLERTSQISAGKPSEAPAEAVQKPPELPDRIKLRKQAFALQDELKTHGYDKDFFNEVIKEGRSYAFDKPNSMTTDEMRLAVRRMLTYRDTFSKTKKLTRKESKRLIREAAIRAKVFHKLPDKPDKDLYNEIKEQFKDYQPETGHVFDWIRGVRHVFRKDKLLYYHGYKPLHDDAQIMEGFIVDQIRPARNKAKEIGVKADNRKKVTWYRHLKYLKMVNPAEYGSVSFPVLDEKEQQWSDYLTETYSKLAGIFKPQNLLPFDMYSPLIFDDTSDDPEMELLGSFYPEGVPKNIEAFWRKKRESINIKNKIFDDSLVLLERYIRSGAKDHFLKEDIKRIRQDLLADKHINETMRKMLQSYTERVLGYPTVMDEAVGQTFAIAISFMGKIVGKKTDYTADDLNNLAHTFINLTYMSTMGLRPMPVLKNLTQSLNTACELGPTWVTSGIIDFLFKGWGPADQAGVLMEYAPELYREYEEQNSFDRLRDIMLIGFQTADKINRSIAYYSALNKFDAFSKIFKNPQKLKKWLLSHHLDEVKRIEVLDAINKGNLDRARHVFAEEIVAKTQYLYNKYDSPLITRSSLGKMYYQFSSWPENYVELLVDWGRNKNYAAFLRATMAAIALGYIASQTDKKWLKKFIYSMSPGAPLPLTEWKLHRYAIPPSMGPLENLLYVAGDIHAFINMQNDPEKFKKRITKDLKRLLLNTMNWAPGGLLAKDIYNWSSIPLETTGQSPRPNIQRPITTRPRSQGLRPFKLRQ